MPNAQVLYRFWDVDDRLLYVGITARPWQRWKEHQGEKAWWSGVAKITMQSYHTRAEVRDAELLAIRTEFPLHNMQNRLKGFSPAEHVMGFLGCTDQVVYCSCREVEYEMARAALADLQQARGTTWDDIQDDWFKEHAATKLLLTPEEFTAHVIQEYLVATDA